MITSRTCDGGGAEGGEEREREPGTTLPLCIRVSRDAYRFLHHLEELGHPELDRTDGLDRALEGDGEGWRGEGREGGGGGGDGG